MKTWNEYKNHAQNMDLDSNKDIREMEQQAAIVSTIIKQRKDLGISQRELASLCNIPQSSVARIESFQTTPNLSTLLKLLRPLGLELNITPKK